VLVDHDFVELLELLLDVVELSVDLIESAALEVIVVVRSVLDRLEGSEQISESASIAWIAVAVVCVIASVSLVSIIGLVAVGPVVGVLLPLILIAFVDCPGLRAVILSVPPRVTDASLVIIPRIHGVLRLPGHELAFTRRCSLEEAKGVAGATSREALLCRTAQIFLICSVYPELGQELEVILSARLGLAVGATSALDPSVDDVDRRAEPTSNACRSIGLCGVM